MMWSATLLCQDLWLKIETSFFFFFYSTIYFLKILWEVTVWDFTRKMPFLCVSEGLS